jgi:tetratricopeptide (TPR) repeat protein
MLRTSSIRRSLIIALLFSISSMPVLGQISNDELISGLFNFVSDGSISPSLIKESSELAIELVGNAHQCDNAVNSYNDAYNYYNYGTHELALRCIDKSIEAWNQTDYLEGLPSAMGNVGPSDSWNLKGLILNKLGRYEEAINCFDFALDINPENYYAWANKGDVLYDQGRYEEAIKCYDSATAINPTYAHAYIQKNNALSILQSSATPQKNIYYGAGSISVYSTP